MNRVRAATWLLNLILASLLLAGCARTVFEQPPSTAAGCDPQLAGRWLSIDDARIGEVELHVGADCALWVLEHRRDGERRSATTTFGSARLRGHNVLWVDAGWAHESFEVEPGPLDRDGDVYVYSYRFDRAQRLRLLGVNSRELARRALERKLDADLLLLDRSLTVRVRTEPEALQALLRDRRSFDARDPLLFQRAPTDSLP